MMMELATPPSATPARGTPGVNRAVGGGGTEVRMRWRMSGEARGLVLVSAILLVFGLAVLYSASAFVAMNEERGSAYFLLRQASGALAGVVAFAVAAKFDAERLHRWAWPLMWFTIACMAAVILLPESIAPRINGSRRFLFGSSFQPSELGKLAVVAWTAMMVVKKGEALRRLSRWILPFAFVGGTLGVLAALEPDLSVAMLYAVLMGVLLFAGGARVGHFVAIGVLAVPVLWQKMQDVHYAALRIFAFLDPGGIEKEVGYQLKQSLIAVGSGGWFGVGFGQGRQQTGFLPYPYSDFIASNIGEEWGFVGLLGITVLFGAYGLLGFRIARSARSPFLQLLAVGLTFVTVLTAYPHVGVVVGLLPTTGLTLPFVSYGRSNLVLTMLFTGILVNVGSTRERVIGSTATNPLSAA
jgi:cell division protein FtsW